MDFELNYIIINKIIDYKDDLEERGKITESEYKTITKFIDLLINNEEDG